MAHFTSLQRETRGVEALAARLAPHPPALPPRWLGCLFTTGSPEPLAIYTSVMPYRPSALFTRGGRARRTEKRGKR